MRQLNIIPFLVLSVFCNAETYYVSTTGNDSSADPTNIATPWKTWQKAFNSTTPRDTCYFRGGVYTDMYSSAYGVRLNTETRNGTHTKPTCYFNYPTEVPVLDCIGMTGGGDNIIAGIEIAQASHLYIKGLTVKNVRQIAASGQARGIHLHNNYNYPADNVNDIKFENCVVHNVNGTGYVSYNADTVRYYNCDAYNMCDSLTTYDPGGWGKGFDLGSDNGNSYAYYYGCRAWNNSDDGFCSSTKGYVEWDNCWSIHNGFSIVDISNNKGGGWKSEVNSPTYKNTAILQMYIHNCIAVDNELLGFTTNDGDGVDPEFRGHFYNNFSFYEKLF
jgi:hypothetical protein